MTVFMSKPIKYKIFIFKTFTFISLLIYSNISFAQMFRDAQKPDKKFAAYCLKFHNYHDGLQEFEALLKLKPENDYYRWGIGYCHLHLNIDKSKSIKYFKTVLSKADADQAVWYDLGDAYMQTNQLDKAEDAFNKYIKSGINDKHEISAHRQIEMINNAKHAFKDSIDVSITNMGKYINSESPELFPYINANEKFMVFSRQSKSNAGRFRHEDGYYAGDIYNSNFKFGRWRKVRRFSSIINSQEIELNGYLSKNASFLYVYKEGLLGKEKKHIIYNKRGRSFGHPKEVIIEGVHMDKVKSLAISNDNKWLIFSAPSKIENRNDLDLYYCHKAPTGNWGKATAFDSTINSEYNECFPYFTPISSKFVFASKGHNSIGGYDLFTAKLSIDSILHLSNIKNIGYPVNTTMDDKTISFNSNCRYACISSLRDGGYGDLDIYRVVFKEQQPLYTVIHGGIFDQDSTNILEVLQSINNHIDTLNFPINRKYKQIIKKDKDSIAAKKYLIANKIPQEKLDIKIKAIDIETNEVIGKFIVKERTGTYAIVLPPGEYRLVFSRKNFEDRFISKLNIEDYDLRNRDIEKHILMHRIR